MLHIPHEWPEGPFARSRLAETLVRIALAGHAAEHVHRSEPFTADAIRDDEVDWQLAWKTAAQLWTDEDARLGYLELEIRRVERFLQHDQYRASVGHLARELLEHGTLNWMQVMDTYEWATDCEERTTEPRNPWKPPRRWE